jgi:hypothetical protein
MHNYVLLIFAICLANVYSFAPTRRHGPTSTNTATATAYEGRLTSKIFSEPNNRRDFVSKSFIAGLVSQILVGDSQNAIAADDLTSQMFNEDGSLKEGVMTDNVAKEKSVAVSFPSSSDSESALVSIDGNGIGSESQGVGITASYSIPEKWTAAPDYLDTTMSVRGKTCERAVVYQVPGTFNDLSTLEKASTIGVAKALGFNTVEKGTFPKLLPTADIVNGRKVIKAASTKDGEEEKRKYYEFDLAVAPDTCGASADNLGMGFCPYDTVVILSATIIDGKMMVCGVTSTKDEWKRANADLKRLRNSFFVEPSSV